MKFYKKAEEAANAILTAFQNPQSLPAIIAPIFIHRKDESPCRSWSFANQLLVAIHGYADARGFRQWEEVGRNDVDTIQVCQSLITRICLAVSLILDTAEELQVKAETTETVNA